MAPLEDTCWPGEKFRDGSRGDGGSGLKEKPMAGATVVIGDAVRMAPEPMGLVSRGEKLAGTCVQLKPPPPLRGATFVGLAVRRA